jgi:tRNA nucleotidyltransferase (CCA-adding enzyme)
MDVATARAETYRRPGALPVVRPADIGADLLRRDFTINAMALALAPEFDGRVIDPSGGRRDLQDGVIRFLHDRSPMDDPTRVFRAVRYAHRFGFAISREARRAIRAALKSGCFEAVSGDRLRREIARLLSERDRAGAVRRMRGLGLHRLLHPSLPAARETLNRLRLFERSSDGPSADWLVYLQVWAAGLSPSELLELAGRLNLSRKDAERLQRGPAPPRAVPGGLSISGKDLLAAGASPGPTMGRALTRTLVARREGKISADEELDYALAILRENP